MTSHKRVPFRRNLSRFQLLLYMTLMALSLVVLFSLTVYANDDWDWGSQRGLDRLLHGLSGYNGRYLGNALAVLLCRVPALKTLFMAAVTLNLMLVPCLMQRRTNNLFCDLLLVAYACVLLMPPSIARQTIGWVSGFINYATGALCVLLVLYGARGLFEDDLKPPSYRAGVLLLLNGLLGALLVEHVTVALVVLPGALYLYGRVRGTRANTLLLALAGAFVGACIMFSNPAYRATLAGGDFYRSTALGMRLPAFLASAWDVWQSLGSPVLIHGSLALLLALSVGALAAPVKNYSRVAHFSRAVVASFPLYLILRQLNPGWQALAGYTSSLDASLSLVYLVALLVFTCSGPFSTPRKRQMVWLWLCAALLTAPLLIVSPVSERCFLPAYVFMCAFTLDMLGQRIEEGFSLRAPALICCAIAICFYVSIHARNLRCELERVAYLRAQAEAGETQASLPLLPYNGFTWHGTPHDEVAEGLYLSFYGLPEDMRLTVVPYEEWYQIRRSL